ncbi:hypothetical protein [Dietzia maris]|uniref:hypothetical protein n=1 Tax=Dietzia maris TaxID=37915 RepID=UPI0037C6CC2D
MSRVLASWAAMTAAVEAIQLHGGSDSPGSIRCYFRRAKADQPLFVDEYAYVQAVEESLTAS